MVQKSLSDIEEYAQTSPFYPNELQKCSAPKPPSEREVDFCKAKRRRERGNTLPQSASQPAPSERGPRVHGTIRPVYG